MASSNRHWPSMFKSKPCNTHHHQWQHHDINSSLLPTACHRSSPYSSGCEERSPEPKPRWNPKPEQIRILEAIFNSGMVNPPRDEIRKIRAQLQEYGQVGDANVFYWFQNRKSRSKHKNRNLQTTTKNQTHHQSPPISVPITSTTNKVPTSSSSSSENKACFSLLNSPTASVNQQPYFGELLQEPYFFPPGAGGFCFPELGNVMNHHGNDQTVGSSSEVLLTDLMMMNNRHGIITKSKVEDEKMKLQPQLSYSVTAPAAPTSVAHSFSAPPTTTTVPSNINYIQGVDESSGLGQAKSTVFINDVAFEVAVGPFNVREAFGDDAVLIHSSGQPVVTNEWGVTLQSLQHGTFYYLLRTLTQVDTVDLI